MSLLFVLGMILSIPWERAERVSTLHCLMTAQGSKNDGEPGAMKGKLFALDYEGRRGQAREDGSTICSMERSNHLDVTNDPLRANGYMRHQGALTLVANGIIMFVSM